MEPQRIELPVGWSMGSVNAYLFTHPEIILVDTGVKTDACWAALVEGLTLHGVAIRDISRVVITHPHVDHFGLAGRIVAESDAMVWVFDQGAPWLISLEEMWAERVTFYRQDFLPRIGLPPESEWLILKGVEELATLADPIPGDRVVVFYAGGALQMGERRWQIIHTPGHAAAQTVFYQSDTGQLLSADMLLAAAPAPVIEQPPAREGQRRPELPLFLRSLDVLDALAIETVLPGHGRPFGDPHQVIARQRARIRQRRDECLELIRGGLQTVPQLVEMMYAHQPPDGRLAGLWMLIGYLDLLVADGLIREEDAGGVRHYSPT
jgi:glyoxylase-like metal-dependent hydrolase (beta-lactamase superfamily II)